MTPTFRRGRRGPESKRKMFCMKILWRRGKKIFFKTSFMNDHFILGSGEIPRIWKEFGKLNCVLLIQFTICLAFY